MTQPAVAVAQPDPGPHHPLAATPRRRPGSARRTTSVDVAMPDRPGGAIAVHLAGQDLVTEPDGTSRVVDELALSMLVDHVTGEIRELAGPCAVPPMDRIVGMSVRSRRELVAALADQGDERTLAYSALEDLPGASLVSGFAMLRAGWLVAAPEDVAARATLQADICAGWATGGPVLVALTDHGHTAVPVGPDGPALEAADPEGWHELPALHEGVVRRRRQLDVWRAGDDVVVQSHFRDSYASDEPEMVMHEYLVDATVDGAGLLTAVDVDPRVLPWDACPQAVASATGVVGTPLAAVVAAVHAELRGPGTCTHLNSTLRCLADVQALASYVDRSPSTG